MAAPNFRNPPLVDKAYRRSARNRHCMVRHPETGDYCNGPPVLAHIVTVSNSGTGMKPPDDESLFLCHDHHAEFDGRKKLAGFMAGYQWLVRNVFIPERKAAYRKWKSEVGR